MRTTQAQREFDARISALTKRARGMTATEFSRSLTRAEYYDIGARAGSTPEFWRIAQEVK